LGWLLSVLFVLAFLQIAVGMKALSGFILIFQLATVLKALPAGSCALACTGMADLFICYKERV
jgi:hypothetical protein